MALALTLPLLAWGVATRDLLGGDDKTPWGSDTWGHLTHAVHLRDSWRAGIAYPSLFPQWYLGIQNLRYWGPLTYIVLAALMSAGLAPIQAGNVAVAGALLCGALGVLRFRRWWGWPLAGAAATLYVLLPDHLRVAFAEGNLPRTLCNALLPWLVFQTLRVLEPDSSARDGVLLALLFAAVMITHAMMAAIFGAGLLLLVICYGLLGGASLQRVSRAAGLLIVGGLLSCWWFLPSLSGGITALDSEALEETLVFMPLSVTLDPFRRWADREAFYIGLALVVVLPFAWRGSKQAATRSLLLVGLATSFLSATIVRSLYLSLPAHSLFWPQRFLSFGATVLLLGCIAALAERRMPRWLGVGALLVLAADVVPSLPLTALRPPPVAVATLSAQISGANGWRVATLDLSRLGSAPAFYLHMLTHREQVFGWAYHGATTARTVGALNWALEHDYLDFASSRLNLLGVDDVLLLDLPAFPRTLTSRLQKDGFQPEGQQVALSWWHRAGSPRAAAIQPQALGIGKGASNLAIVFPSLLVGDSTTLDAYSLDELKRFPTLVLSGFDWHDQEQAEALVRDYALAGGHVVIDLTGAPLDPFARVPKFLDVYGEPVWLTEPITAETNDQVIPLRSFSTEYRPWLGTAPQGLTEHTVSFRYLGERAVLTGWKHVTSSGKGAAPQDARVWFVGANLPFHALLTRDPAATVLLGDVLRLKPSSAPTMSSVPLKDYVASTQGYDFEVELTQPTLLLIPVGAQEGMRVLVDGTPTPLLALEQLVALSLPAGAHVVEMRVLPTSVHRIALVISFVGVLLLAEIWRRWPRSTRSIV